MPHDRKKEKKGNCVTYRLVQTISRRKKKTITEKYVQKNVK